MPFCCQCGTPVQEMDRFCANCGARQPVAAPSGSGPAAASAAQDFLSGISPRSASLLCYIPVVGWIAAIVVLASQRFREDRDVRFHAFQGLYLFVAWLIVDWVVGPGTRFLWHDLRWMFPFGGILKGLIFVAWILMIIKTGQGQTIRLPILGELAERSVAEQK